MITLLVCSNCKGIVSGFWRRTDADSIVHADPAECLANQRGCAITIKLCVLYDGDVPNDHELIEAIKAGLLGRGHRLADLLISGHEFEKEPHTQIKEQQ